MGQPNELLRKARLCVPSPSGSGRPMSRQELADAVNGYLFRTIGRVFEMDDNHVGKLERGEHRWPGAHYREALRAVLKMDTDADLGFYVVRGGASTDQLGRPDRWMEQLAQPPRRGDDQTSTGEVVQRRKLFERAGGALFIAVLNTQLGPAVGCADLAAALTTYDPPHLPATEPDLDLLAAAVSAAKRNYQQCRYAQVRSDLPALLEALRAARHQLHGDEVLRVHALAADAYQVAGSVLVKGGEASLARSRSGPQHGSG